MKTKTAETWRAVLARLATVTLTTEPEDMPVRGNAMASDDDAADKEVEDEIIRRLDDGDEWAWCVVRVRASLHGQHADAYLGGCSYRDEAEFKAGGYFEDMRDEALDALARKTLLAHVLFNCQRGNSEPDWSRFDGVEVSPVARNEQPDGSTECEVIHDDRTPDMWSVYGHYDPNKEAKNGARNFGVDCLTDCDTEELAQAIGVLFRKLIAEARG